jgi:hypothetical protein
VAIQTRSRRTMRRPISRYLYSGTLSAFHYANSLPISRSLHHHYGAIPNSFVRRNGSVCCWRKQRHITRGASFTAAGLRLTRTGAGETKYGRATRNLQQSAERLW